MVKKDKLLTDLKGFLIFEEDATKELSDFYQTVTPNDAIEKGLAILRGDTKKHVRLIKEMIEYMERSDKNEF